MVLPINANRNSTTSRWTNELGFVGVFIQSGSACILLRTKGPLIKIYDSVREHTYFISLVEVQLSKANGKIFKLYKEEIRQLKNSVVSSRRLIRKIPRDASQTKIKLKNTYQ